MTLKDLADYKDKYSDMKLKDLAIEFLERHNFKYNSGILQEGRLSGAEHKLDFLITGQEGKDIKNIKTGMIIKDYRKSTGADAVCQVERLIKDLTPNINQIILLANEFSVPARNLAERCGVPTISRGELISMLWNPQGL